MLTRRGELWCAVWASSQGYVAESLDGYVSAFAETDDEAVARLVEAMDRIGAPDWR